MMLVPRRLTSSNVISTLASPELIGHDYEVPQTRDHYHKPFDLYNQILESSP